MSDFSDVFERCEEKYRLNAAQYDTFMNMIGSHLAPDEFTDSDIYSLYYDTPESTLINRSLEKPLYKEKFRIRAYALPVRAGDLVFMELKKKFKGIVYKRRVGCSAAATNAFLAGQDFETAIACYPTGDPELDAKAASFKSVQIAHEIDFMFKRYANIRPAMFISCHRDSYLTDGPCSLRLTFDDKITWRDNQLSFAAGSGGRDLLEPGERLMEIKCAGAYPQWLVEALDFVHVYPTSFSKYGHAYQLSASERLLADAAAPAPHGSASGLPVAEPSGKAPQQTDRTTYHRTLKEGVYCA